MTQANLFKKHSSLLPFPFIFLSFVKYFESPRDGKHSDFIYVCLVGKSNLQILTQKSFCLICFSGAEDCDLKSTLKSIGRSRGMAWADGAPLKNSLYKLFHFYLFFPPTSRSSQERQKEPPELSKLSDLPRKSGTERQQLIGPLLPYCPKLNSRKNNGMPAKTSMMIQGIRNAPPPLLKQRYGKRQTLPRPTAQLTQESMKSRWLDQLPRSWFSSMLESTLVLHGLSSLTNATWFYEGKSRRGKGQFRHGGKTMNKSLQLLSNATYIRAHFHSAA